MLIAEDAHVMLSAAISTRNINLITDTIMCVTDLVAEIQTRFIVAVRPGVGKSMTFGASRLGSDNVTQASFPCPQCDRKFATAEGLHEHAKIHAVTAENEMHSATQRLHSLSSQADPGSAVSKPRTLNVGIQCYMCDAVLPDRSSYTKHLKTHTSEAKSGYKCGDCSQVFANTDELRFHMMNRECLMGDMSEKDNSPSKQLVSPITHTEVSAVKCKDCHRVFTNFQELHLHTMNRDCWIGRPQRQNSKPESDMAAVDPKEHYSQPALQPQQLPTPEQIEPDYISTTKSKATENIQQLPSLKCPLCEKTFDKIFQLNLHLSRHQDTYSSGRFSSGLPVADKTYSCQFCMKEYNHMSNRKRHEKMCKYNPDVKKLTSVSKHVTQETRELPGLSEFTCRHCDKVFSDNSNRRRHERVCYKASPEVTESGVDKSQSNSPSHTPTVGTNQASDVTVSAVNYKRIAANAKAVKAVDDGGKVITSFSCTICAKLINTRNSLEHHYMTHLGIRPHACQWCGRRFTDPSNCRKHQRMCSERAIDADMSDVNDLPTMVPQPSSHIPASRGSVSELPHPVSNPSSSVSEVSPISQQVKLEPLEITTGAAVSQPELCNDTGSQGEGQDSELDHRQQNKSHADSTATHNRMVSSVVVDSSWFVGDQNITALSDEESTQ